MSREDGIASILSGSTMRAVDMAGIDHGDSPDRIKFAPALGGPEYQTDPPPVENEWLWARLVSPGRYEVENIPFFAKSFSRFDHIVCSSGSGELEGYPTFAGVVRRGGHSTYRIRLENEDHYSKDDKYSIWYLLNLLIESGCEFELGDFGLVAVDAGPSAKLGAIVYVLKSGFDLGVWDWQRGYIDEDNPHF